MADHGSGRWKEGRYGAASLCYDGVDGAALAWVTAHHARVGIRATLAGCGDEEMLATLAARNWELMATAPAGRTTPARADEAQAAIASLAEAEDWGVWRIDDATLAGWGVDGHSRLLGWLGSQHARIWCAPCRDIAAWLQASGAIARPPPP